MLEATPGTKVTLNKGDPARLLQNDSSQTLTQLLIYPPSSYLLPNSCGLGTVLGIVSLKKKMRPSPCPPAARRPMGRLGNKQRVVSTVR